MMPRKITSLQEDMNKLGLTRLINPEINRQRPAAPAPQRTGRAPVTEARDQPLTPKQKQKLAEQRQALKERKDRAKVQRESRMTKKAAIFETRMQRIDRKSKEKKSKVESRIRAVKGLDKRIKALESYDLVKAMGGKQPTGKQLGESYMKVASLAGTLARTFAVLENFLGEAEGSMGIPVMHPDSAYGYDTNVNNVGDGAVPADGGVATDYATNKPKNEDDDEPVIEPKDDEPTTEDDDPENKDDVTTEDDDPENKDDEPTTEDDDPENKDDVTTEDDDPENKDDEPTTEDDDPENKDDEPTTEGDDPEDDDKKKEESRRRARAESIAQKMPMDYELHSIRMEAEEMGVKVADGKAQNVNMGYATELLNDMVSYLGGAMKLYFKVQQSMQNYGYVGQDQPVAAGGEPVPTQIHNDAYVGAAQPAGGTAVGQGGGPGNAPKTGDVTDKGGPEAPAAK